MRSFFKSKIVQFGLPFMGFCLGGSIFLREFVKLRYDFRTTKQLSNKEIEELGIKMRPNEEKTPEAIYERHVKKLDIDAWENVRGPRVWEKASVESYEIYKQKKIKEKKEQIALKEEEMKQIKS